MKNSEEAIERVLAGLRDVEAPDGIERRILAGLEGRVQARSGWRRSMPMWLVMPQGRFAARGLGWGLISVAALAGVLIALAIPAMRRAGRTPDHSKIGGGSVEAVPMMPSVMAARDAEPSSPRRGVHWKGTRNASETGSFREADSADSDDSVALSETQAASFPAPPMRLTEQERLLLRLVHKVDPVEIAMLDPTVRAMQDAKEKAEFQRFFGQTAKQSLPAELPPGQSPTELAAPERPATEQAMPQQSAPEQSAPTQPTQEQPTQEQPTPEQLKPQNIAPDQSTTTQQLTPRPLRTGENE